MQGLLMVLGIGRSVSSQPIITVLKKSRALSAPEHFTTLPACSNGLETERSPCFRAAPPVWCRGWISVQRQFLAGLLGNSILSDSYLITRL